MTKRTQTLLLVDDSPVDRALYRRLLKHDKTRTWVVLEAETGKEAMEFCRTHELGCILLDYHLPDCTCLDFIKSLGQDGPFYSIPVVILTGQEDELLGLKAVQAGAQDFLLKGKLDSQVLIRSLHYAIERNQLLRAQEQEINLLRQKHQLEEFPPGLQNQLGPQWNRTLEAREARFRVVIDQNVDGMVIVGEDGTIRFLNPSAEALFARPKQQLLGGAFGYPVIPGETTEITLLREEKHPVTVEMRVVEIDWGNETAHLASLRDITLRKVAEEERKRAETQMQYIQRLESLGILAGGIAHDFNNLLMTIMAHSGLAAKKMPLESPGRDHLQKIEQAALRGGELANQMLAYAGKGRPVIQTINLSTLVEEMGHLLSVSISKLAVLTYDLMAEIPPVQVDPSQIRQVVMNLIMNASEAIGERSGMITLRSGVMAVNRAYLSQGHVIGDLPDGECAYLEVQDTGTGIDEETMEKIFDPFFTTKFTGRGLGLAALLGIVRAHGGAIKVTSQVGEGTSFRILLPCAHTHEFIPQEGRDGNGSWEGSGTVLVVDDEEDVRVAAQLILEDIGFRILTARDGRAGLDMFRTNLETIQAVLLDLTMPHMSGEELFQEIRQLRPDIPIILSSGYSEEEALKRFAGKGINAFIQKPYQIDSLIDKIRQIFEKAPSLPS